MSEKPAEAQGLRVVVGADDTSCRPGGTPSVTVTNSKTATCDSDIMATLSSGEKLMFSSKSGYGGAQGSWGPLPPNLVDGVGVIQYPPGTRTWPLTLPSLREGAYSFTLPIGCGTQTTEFVATFTITTG